MAADAQQLTELAERAEQATGPDRDLDRAIQDWWFANVSPPSREHIAYPAYDFSASLDAAMSLLSDDSEYDLTNLYGVARAHVDMANEYGGHHGSNECGKMPLAVCAAALRAHAALLQGNQNG